VRVAYRLGIDLGTSTTVAVLDGPSSTRPLLFDASPLLSSAVFAGSGPDLLTGLDAERAAIAQPAGLEANPKRRIDDGTIWLGERDYPVAEVLAAILRRVGAEARRVAGVPIAEMVLTHPAAWGRTRLSLLADAAARAGLGEPGMVPEPVVAAAYFATVRDLAAGQCVVVYDLGAGTFDVSVVRRAADGFEVVVADGWPTSAGSISTRPWCSTRAGSRPARPTPGAGSTGRRTTPTSRPAARCGWAPGRRRSS
jgi:molecular chaperone DnaK (HSP70)